VDFNDPRWTGLHGGYRIPYDPRAAIRAIAEGAGAAAAWQELWNGLHHQGDVGEAFYAAVPHLVRIHADRGVPKPDTYALEATIGDARQHGGGNPEIPAFLREGYDAAWRHLTDMGLRELGAVSAPAAVSAIIAAIAIGKGMPALGRMAMLVDEDERKEMLEDAGLD